MGMHPHTINGLEIKLDPALKQKLDNVKILQDNDFDAFFMIDGLEGSGKSTLGMTCAWYLTDGRFTPENIGETIPDTKQKLKLLPPGSTLLIDEGSLILSSADGARTTNRELKKIINVIRQKRMVVILIAPAFHFLDEDITTRRCRFLLNCRLRKGLKRGTFMYFGEKQLRSLWTNNRRKGLNYKQPSAKFVGSFSDFRPDWLPAYKETKLRTLDAAFDEGEKKVVKEDKMRVVVEGLLKELPELSARQIARILGMHHSTLVTKYRDCFPKLNRGGG